MLVEVIITAQWVDWHPSKEAFIPVYLSAELLQSLKTSRLADEMNRIRCPPFVSTQRDAFRWFEVL